MCPKKCNDLLRSAHTTRRELHVLRRRSTGAAVIQVEGLTKTYGERTAVRDVSFSVDRGEIVGFLGPNGAGKTTTLRMITGYLSPSAGSVSVDGIDVSEDPITARQRIGYLPEGVPLYPELRVREYLKHRAMLKRVDQVKARIDKALSLAKITDVADRIVGQLSKGYRQRVGIADALLADPPLLILDEPTSGLDPNQIRQVRDLIKSFSGEKTVFLSTHILPEVEATCDRVVIIHKGRLVGKGTPESLRGQAEGSQVITLVGRFPAGQTTRAKVSGLFQDLEGVEALRDVARLGEGVYRCVFKAAQGDGVLEAISSAAVAGGMVLRELSQSSARLEDVFADLTTAEAEAARDEGGEKAGGEDEDGEEEGVDTASDVDQPAEDSGQDHDEDDREEDDHDEDDHDEDDEDDHDEDDHDEERS
ncbi:MAG: ABC transporter ATP-binding protein [Myxococcota bacterium]